jgi:hypothetical protein
MALFSFSRGRAFNSLWRNFAVALLSIGSIGASDSKASPNGPKTVHVREYVRKDGTVVHAYDRAAPSSKTLAPATSPPSASATPRVITPAPQPTRAHASAPQSVGASSSTTPEVTIAAPKPGPAAANRAASVRATKTAPSTATGPILRNPNGRIERNAAAKSAFQESHPCPATGLKTGSCPGYIVDHVKPLACGGADAQANMQWQTTVAAKEKDKIERAGCPSR